MSEEPTYESVIGDLQDHLADLRGLMDVSNAYLDGVTDGMASSDNVTGVVAALVAKTRSLTKVVQSQTSFLGVTLKLLRLLADRSNDLNDREADLTKLIAQIVEVLGDRLPPKAVDQRSE